jgi:glycosyltransferase involved in cell wall biosynthesis
MALGKPVIVTDPEGAPDYVEFGVSGYFLNYGDAEGLRKYIMLLMENPSLRSRIGEEAKKRAWKEFSPTVYQRRILKELGLALRDESSDGNAIEVSRCKTTAPTLDHVASVFNQ